jgi:plastocyanin
MTRSRLRFRLVAALLVALPLVAACANDDGSEASGGGETGPAVSAPTGATATGSTGATGDDGKDTPGYGDTDGGEDDPEGEDDAGGQVTLQANNFAFDPAELRVKSGKEINVKNGNANTPHTFTVEGTDIDLELSPLDVEDVEIDLDPGEYGFLCRFHDGMTGTLTVT